ALPQLAPQDLQTLLPSPAPRTGLTPEEYSALKDEVSQQSAPTRSATAPPPALPPDSLLTPSASVSFTGQGQSFCGAIPSDMALAVGTTFVVQANNSCIAVFSKNGTLQAGFPKSLDAFLGLPASAFPFDPRALYDWVNNRFILVVDRFANNVG